MITASPPASEEADPAVVEACGIASSDFAPAFVVAAAAAVVDAVIEEAHPDRIRIRDKEIASNLIFFSIAKTSFFFDISMFDARLNVNIIQ